MKQLLIWMPLLLASCTKEIISGKPADCTTADYTTHPKHQSYQQELQAFHANDDAPGTLLAIKKGSEPLWIGTMGKSNLETNADMQPCTPFRTGSITKAFTAVVIMKLQEQGKLKLEDKLADLLPETKNKIPRSEQITVRQLLNHSSGITDPKNDDPAYQLQLINDPASIANMTMAERLRRYVYGRPLRFAPGTATHYANSGYWLLGEIIGRLTRKSMQEVLHEMIFRPVGMSNTYYERRNNPQLSHGYNIIHGGVVDVTRWDAADGDADPGSGVISTAKDLVQFGFSLFKGGLVSQASLQAMQTISVTPDCGGDCPYGLGIESWNAGPLKGYGKNGFSVGVDANWIFYPEQDACLVFFKNMGNGSSKDFIERIVSY